MAKTKVITTENGSFDEEEFVRNASVHLMAGLLASSDSWASLLSSERKAEEAVAMAKMLLKKLDK